MIGTNDCNYHLHGYKGREVTRVVGEKKRTVIALTTCHLVIPIDYHLIRTIEGLIISLDQKGKDYYTSKGRYIPPNGIGARASPKASFNTVSAITMMGRLCEKVTFDIKHFVIAPENVGQGKDVHLLQGLIEGVRLVLHTDSGQP